MRKGLTKARILEESKSLVDLGGPQALTMRALAASLGVAPMAIYNHFQDRDAILDAVADDVFERLRQSSDETGTPMPLTTDWRRKMRAMLLGAQRLASRHPHIFRIALSRPNKPASAFALTADAIQVLQGAGLTAAQAVTAYNAFVILLHGYPFWEEGIQLHGMPVPGVGGELCLPGDSLPEEWTASRQFEAIVDWLLRSIEQTVAATLVRGEE